MRRLRLPGILIVIPLMVGGLFLVPYLLRDPTAPESYARENEKVLEQLPLYPGAVEAERSTEPHLEGPGPPVAYTTVVIYDAPTGTRPKAVLDFYRRRLSGWRLAQPLGRGVDVVTGKARRGRWGVTFRRRTARVSVDAEQLARVPGDRFTLGVDYYEPRAS